MSLKEIFKLVLGWRLILVLVSLPAMLFLTARDRFVNLTVEPSISNIFSMWSNFDGRNYLKIAEFGYGYQHKSISDFSFFPVYPGLIRIFNIFGDYLASGLIVSHLALIFALYYLYRLIVFDFKPKVARLAVYLVLLFPTAFFFGSVYTESVFLLLSILTFYFIRQKSFFLACLFACLASATRVTGVFLWIALIYEYWQINGKNLKNFLNPESIWLLLPPLGFLSFVRFQFLNTGDPYFFINFQNTFADRTTEKIILLYQVFFRYSKMIVFMDHMDPLFYTILLELICATLVLLILIFSFRKIRFSYWIFMFLSYLLPTLTGSFSSMPRYVLGMFPVFIFISSWIENQHPYIKYFYYAFSVVFSIFAITFFTRGYFVG